MEFFRTIFYEPIYNILIFLYDVLWSDLGIAIIVLTILIKLVLLPMSRKQIVSQKEMQEIQPKLKEVQKKYKDDREKLARETMALYKEHKINPAAGCLPLIVQMIIFITLYRVIINLSQNHGFETQTSDLYAFVPDVGHINEVSVAILNMADPSYFLAVITAIAQYYQIKMMQGKNENKEEKTEEKKDGAPDFATVMQKQMLIFIPIMTLFIGFTFPAALTLYWLTSTVFMIGQQLILMKKA